METNKEKNNLLENLPFYSFIGLMGVTLIALIVYIVWALIFG